MQEAGVWGKLQTETEVGDAVQVAAKVEETGQLPKRAVECKQKTKYGT